MTLLKNEYLNYYYLQKKVTIGKSRNMKKLLLALIILQVFNSCIFISQSQPERK